MKNTHFIFSCIEMLIWDLSHFASYIWTLCAEVVLSVRTLGPIQSEGRASTFPITFFTFFRQVDFNKMSTSNSWKVATVFFSRNVLASLQMCSSNYVWIWGAAHWKWGFHISDCYGFKKHSMQRSKAVWINFHGNQLSRPKKFY